MTDGTPDFDAADLADEILGISKPDPPRQPAVWTATEPHPGRGLGWALSVALVVACAIAISLAVQSKDALPSPPEPCVGLYHDGICCVEEPDRDERGLFDAETRFASRTQPPEWNC